MQNVQKKLRSTDNLKLNYWSNEHISDKSKLGTLKFMLVEYFPTINKYLKVLNPNKRFCFIKQTIETYPSSFFKRSFPMNVDLA